MDSNLYEIPENENSWFFKEPTYSSFELLRKVAGASGTIDPAAQDMLTRNFDADAKHYRELTSYNKQQLFRYYARRDWHTLIKLLLIIGYNLACICFSNSPPDGYVMACSNSAICAIAFRDRLRNLTWSNKWNNQKNDKQNKQSLTSP